MQPADGSSDFAHDGLAVGVGFTQVHNDRQVGIDSNLQLAAKRGTLHVPGRVVVVIVESDLPDRHRSRI